MRRWSLKLGKYGISGKRYKELCGFCEQYPEWKHELSSLPVLRAVQIDGMPHGSSVGDPTSALALRRHIIELKCMLIEETAKEASPELWQYIIQSVCYNKPYRAMDIPSSQIPFFTQRRYFFFLLDKRKS